MVFRITEIRGIEISWNVEASRVGLSFICWYNRDKSGYSIEVPLVHGQAWLEFVRLDPIGLQCKNPR